MAATSNSSQALPAGVPVTKTSQVPTNVTSVGPS
ncbi:uncharacterized protein METZ01_LOCUS469060, partial [marine metagenome]